MDKEYWLPNSTLVSQVHASLRTTSRKQLKINANTTTTTTTILILNKTIYFLIIFS